MRKKAHLLCGLVGAALACLTATGCGSSASRPIFEGQ
jgi:hypothetical protein